MIDPTKPRRDRKLFGEVLFSGSPFIRWTLLPVCFLCVIVFGIMTFSSALGRDLVPALVEFALTLGCAAMCIAMIFPHCGWAIRLITGLVFCAYLASFVHEWFFDLQGGLSSGQTQNEPTPRNSLRGLIIIGLPCLWYTVFGRFSSRRSEL